MGRVPGSGVAGRQHRRLPARVHAALALAGGGAGGHRAFSGKVGLRTPTLTGATPITDAMMDLRSLVEKAPTPICCAR